MSIPPPLILGPDGRPACCADPVIVRPRPTLRRQYFQQFPLVAPATIIPVNWLGGPALTTTGKLCIFYSNATLGLFTPSYPWTLLNYYSAFEYTVAIMECAAGFGGSSAGLITLGILPTFSQLKCSLLMMEWFDMPPSPFRLPDTTHGFGLRVQSPLYTLYAGAPGWVTFALMTRGGGVDSSDLTLIQNGTGWTVCGYGGLQVLTPLGYVTYGGWGGVWVKDFPPVWGGGCPTIFGPASWIMSTVASLPGP